MKSKSVKPRKNVCRAFCFFLLNTKLSSEEKSSAKNCPLEMKNVCCQVVNPSFAWLIWLPTTDGTICSCRLRAVFLSSRTAAVAGYTACCQHGNGNWHIVFVSNRVWFGRGVKVSNFIQFSIKAFFCPLETERNLFWASASPNSPLGLRWVGIASSLASPMHNFSITYTAVWAWQCACNVRGVF